MSPEDEGVTLETREKDRKKALKPQNTLWIGSPDFKFLWLYNIQPKTDQGKRELKKKTVRNSLLAHDSNDLSNCQ